MSFQPPPTWALPVAVDETTGKASFNPIWLKWFVDLAGVLNKSGVSSSGTLAHNSLGGLQGGLAAERYHLNFLEYTRITGGVIGTVTDVSVASANGFAGTVATSTTTPVITLTTSIVANVLKGSAGAIIAAVAGTDYQAPITPAALTKVDDTNVTLTLGGTPATALLQAASITVNWSGLLASSRGGTGNGFTKFFGPTTAEKTKTFRDANDTILELGGSYTPSGNWTNLTMITPVLGTPQSGNFSTGVFTWPTFNQNTAGSAASLTTTRTIGGSNFDGTANVTSFPSPGAIGGTTPASGAFTTLSATGLLDISAASAGQISFPATQNASAGANVLDDYEEGTWTPVLTFATPGSLTVVYSNQVGAYTKIGRQVTVTFIIVTSTFTLGTASGNLTISGLPFTAAATYIHNGALDFQGITKAGYTNFVANIAASLATVVIRASGSAQTLANVIATDTPTGGTVILRGTVTYFV